MDPSQGVRITDTKFRPRTVNYIETLPFSYTITKKFVAFSVQNAVDFNFILLKYEKSLCLFLFSALLDQELVHNRSL